MKTKFATLTVLIMAAFVCPDAKAQGCASTTGASNAASFSTASYSGSTFTWSNPGNAQTSDASYATGGLTLGAFAVAHSDYLTIQNFGFSIPASATICKIIVEVERSASGLGVGGGVKDQSIRLLKNGTLYGNDLASAAAWPGSDGTVTYGNALLAGAWGGAWQPSDVNNANFGVALSVSLNTGLLGLFMRGKINQVRVTVIYDPNSLLAFVLGDFSATRATDGHRLSWTAGAGIAGSRFIIQRSGNSRDWQELATIPAASEDDAATMETQSGSAGSYSYIDHSPLDGANYYRLRMVNADGRSIYSTVTELTEERSTVRCWPNPFSNVIYVTGPSSMKSVVLKDLQGRTLYVKEAAASSGDWQIPAAGLPPGFYFVQVGTQTFKMLKK